jgi:hypothetical protein
LGIETRTDFVTQLKEIEAVENGEGKIRKK